MLSGNKLDFLSSHLSRPSVHPSIRPSVYPSIHPSTVLFAPYLDPPHMASTGTSLRVVRELGAAAAAVPAHGRASPSPSRSLGSLDALQPESTADLTTTTTTTTTKPSHRYALSPFTGKDPRLSSRNVGGAYQKLRESRPLPCSPPIPSYSLPPHYRLPLTSPYNRPPPPPLSVIELVILSVCNDCHIIKSKWIHTMKLLNMLQSSHPLPRSSSSNSSSSAAAATLKPSRTVEVALEVPGSSTELRPFHYYHHSNDDHRVEPDMTAIEKDLYQRTTMLSRLLCRYGWMESTYHYHGGGRWHGEVGGVGVDFLMVIVELMDRSVLTVEGDKTNVDWRNVSFLQLHGHLLEYMASQRDATHVRPKPDQSRDSVDQRATWLRGGLAKKQQPTHTHANTNTTNTARNTHLDRKLENKFQHVPRGAPHRLLTHVVSPSLATSSGAGAGAGRSGSGNASRALPGTTGHRSPTSPLRIQTPTTADMVHVAETMSRRASPGMEELLSPLFHKSFALYTVVDPAEMSPILAAANAGSVSNSSVRGSREERIASSQELG